MPVKARFRARRVANELAKIPAIVAHSRSFSKSRAEPAGDDPWSDGGKTGRKEIAQLLPDEEECSEAPRQKRIGAISDRDRLRAGR